VVSDDGAYGGSTGVSASNACRYALTTARDNRSVLMMPVFDGVNGTGSHATFSLDGLSAFVLTGYALPGISAASSLSGQRYCSGSDKCLYGYFTTEILPKGSVSGTATNYGVSAVALVG